MNTNKVNEHIFLMKSEKINKNVSNEYIND